MDIEAYIQSGIIESYVLGIADDTELAELEQLRLQYPAINQAINNFEKSLEKTALANAYMPPTHIKTALFAALEPEFIKTEGPAGRGKLVSLNRGIVFSRWLAVAAIVLLVLSASLNFYFYAQFRSTNQAFQALLLEKNTLLTDNVATQTKLLDLYQSMQLMSDPVYIKVAMPGIKGKENNLATVFWNTKSKDVYVLANKLPQAAPDKQYQLWAIVDGKPVDAGLIGLCNGLCKMKNIPKASTFAITLENKGGNPTPTLDQMYVAGKVS